MQLHLHLLVLLQTQILAGMLDLITQYHILQVHSQRLHTQLIIMLQETRHAALQKLLQAMRHAALTAAPHNL